MIFFKLVIEILNALTTLEQRQSVMMTAIQKIQNVLKPTLSADNVYEPRQYKEVDDFEAFCDELPANKELRDGYVSKRNVREM